VPEIWLHDIRNVPEYHLKIVTTLRFCRRSWLRQTSS